MTPFDIIFGGFALLGVFGAFIGLVFWMLKKTGHLHKTSWTWSSKKEFIRTDKGWVEVTDNPTENRVESGEDPPGDDRPHLRDRLKH